MLSIILFLLFLSGCSLVSFVNPVHMSLGYYLDGTQRYFQRVRAISKDAQQSPCVRDLSVASILQSGPGLELELTQGKRLVHVSQSAIARGLRFGDRVVSVRFEVPHREPLELAGAATLTVARSDEEEITVSLTCGESFEAEAAFSEVLSSASNRDWTGCISALRRLQNQLQFETSAMATLRLRCVTAKDVSENPGDLTRSREVGMALFRIAEISMDEAVHVFPGNETAAYSVMEATQAVLSALEFYDLADEVERRFLSVLRKGPQ